MRWTAAVALVLLLPGCSQAPEQEVAPPDPLATGPAAVDPWHGGTSVLLVEGNAPWDDRNGLGTFYQVLTLPGWLCQGSQGEEPWGGQMHVTGRFPQDPAPNGTSALRVQAEWTEADYLGGSILLVFRAPGADSYGRAEVQNGKPADVAFPVEHGPELAGDWDFWFCNVPDFPAQGPAGSAWPFVGNLAFRVEAVRAVGPPA